MRVPMVIAMTMRMMRMIVIVAVVVVVVGHAEACRAADEML